MSSRNVAVVTSLFELRVCACAHTYGVREGLKRRDGRGLSGITFEMLDFVSFALLVGIVLTVKELYPMFGLTAKKKAGIHPATGVDFTRDKVIGVDASALIHKAFRRLNLRSLREVSTALHFRRKEIPSSLGDAIYEVFAEVVDSMRQGFQFRKIVFVFDGQLLPGKRDTKNERMRKCRDSFNAAYDPAHAGDESKHKEHLAASLFISWEVYKIAIGVCRTLKCPAYVAVSEADSQLAYMNRLGEIDYILGEDGDFVIHGASRVLIGFLQPVRGGKKPSNGGARLPGFLLHTTEHLKEISYDSNGKQVRIDVSGWDKDDLLFLAICLGCDYGSVAGVGKVSAPALVQKVRELKEEGESYTQWLAHVEAVLRTSGPTNLDVDETMVMVRKAALSYRTQWVYNTEVCQ
jgi:5'-3' exonuclease